MLFTNLVGAIVEIDDAVVVERESSESESCRKPDYLSPVDQVLLLEAHALVILAVNFVGFFVKADCAETCSSFVDHVQTRMLESK